MNRKLLISSLLAAAAVAPVAHAQAPAKNAPPATAPAAAAPAPVAITLEMRVAIKDLLDTMKTREGLTQTLQQMSQSVRPQMGQLMAQRIEANATLSPDQKQQVRASMEQPFEGAVAEGQRIITDPKVVDETLERIVQGYARTFSVDEIRQMATFYKSPTGQKALASLPGVVQGAMQGTMQGLAPKLTTLADTTVNKQVDAVTKGGSATKAPAAKK